jgi:alpha-tubulin suppressor-like RCC1 family protein/sugar lactone lactonase YvrE
MKKTGLSWLVICAFLCLAIGQVNASSLAVKPAISAGSNFTCGLSVEGNVYCWGDNHWGQMGNGAISLANVLPVQVTGLANGVSAIAAGSVHVCALTSAGAVECWGQIGSGQLGNGATVTPTTQYSSTPVQVTGLTSGVVAISAGYYHSCAVTSAGAAVCWGANEYGQLGNGTTTNSPTPVQVAGLSSGVVALAAGRSHTCALTSAGAVECWGYNSDGELGNGTTTNSPTPVQVAGLTSGVVAIAAGYAHTCALLSTGSLQCWGYNFYRQLGNGTTTNSTTPVQAAVGGVVDVGPGENHTCAVNNSYEVFCWGDNRLGQVGVSYWYPLPTLVLQGGVLGYPVGITAGSAHSCVLMRDGSVECWGSNGYGQLGFVNVFSTLGFVVDLGGLGIKLNLTKLSQTISFPTINTMSVLALPFDISATATASSGLTVSLMSLTPAVCSVSGSTVTLLTIGICSLKATQAGSTSYYAATPVSQTFTVAVATNLSSTSLAVDLPAASAGQTVTLTATVTGSAPTGLVQFFDAGTPLGAAQPLTSGQAILQTNALAVGSHTLSASYLGDAVNAISTSALVTLVVSPVVKVVSTLAGSSLTGSADGTGSAASFNQPNGVAVDAAGNVYVPDKLSYKIRKITAAGVVSTLAGSGVAGSADGNGTAASFYVPNGVAVDTSGNVYVADINNNKIRKITAAAVVSTLAGSGAAGSADGTGTAASFSGPAGVAVDAAGNVYVADTYNNKIRKITAAGVVSTLAGSGAIGSADANGTAASFYHPAGVAVDTAGNVVVADQYNHKIRKITAAGVVSTLAGSGVAGSAEGNGIAASFNNPTGVAVDAVGNVVVADYVNNKIRKITPAGVVSTLAGSGVIGSVDGTGTAASFYNPVGVAVDATGNVYVADIFNNKIRKITGSVATTSAVTVNPNPALTGQTVTLTATVTGSAPTGLVQFFDAGTPLGAAQPLTSGQATLQINALAVGSHTLLASYLGDANNYLSVSSTLNLSVQASLVSQTITFAAIANKSPSALPGSFTLAAPIASSGLAVSLGSLTGSVCSVSGTTVTLLAAGTCTLQATQAGNSIYAPAPSVTQTFSITSPVNTGSGDVPLPPWAYVLLAVGLMGAMWRYQRPFRRA